MAVVEEEEESITRAEMWRETKYYTNYFADFGHKLTRLIRLRKFGSHWNLYIGNSLIASAILPDPPQKDKSFLDSALEAFKDTLRKLDRAIPYLPKSKKASWDCLICGEFISERDAIAHIESHLTIVKSANKR
jgi:hypothetical protein